jgi:D-glycero-D-manno-heptose 1,7-bisphosphate phosphatase
MRRAVFLDKDGTLVHDVPYNVDPARVRLRRDAGHALNRLQHSGYALVLATNQAGVAHGLFTEGELDEVWEELLAQLSAYGVVLDGIYYCPHDPRGAIAGYACQCECHKPQPGLLLRAAEQHHIDLPQSWVIGDILDDIEAGRRAGCRTVLLNVDSETEWRRGAMRTPHFVAHTLTDAVDIIISRPVPEQR